MPVAPVADDAPLKRTGPGILALWACCGYVAALALSVATGHYFAHERNLRAMERFGAQTAEDVAFLATDSMLRGDRIRLGLLAKRIAERPEVRSVEIYDADDAALAVEGNPRSAAPAFGREAAIQDIVAGRVRVTLQADRFRPPTWDLLARSSAFLAIGLLVVGAAAYYHGRRNRSANPPGVDAHDHPDEADSSGVFVVLASLFPRRAAQTEGGRDAVARAVPVAERVANLYAGEAAPWRDAGVALTFRATPSEDRAFEVVCAALLLKRLLSVPRDDEERAPFRFGLDLVADEGADAEALAVMASLAPDRGLVIGRRAHAVLGDAERLSLAALDHPAYEALAGDAVPQGVVTGTDVEHEALIARQADLVRGG